jgi:hypothetical protein
MFNFNAKIKDADGTSNHVEQLRGYRPKGAPFVVNYNSNTYYDADGNRNYYTYSISLVVDGYWSDVVNATVQDAWKQGARAELRTSSGGRLTEEREGNVAVERDTDAYRNLANAIVWASAWADELEAELNK